jgi:hypothetical protein
MTMPGFTAEASLARARPTPRGVTRPETPGPGVSPAQVVATPYARVGVLALNWQIFEPNCYYVCLPWWGGYCRWICY